MMARALLSVVGVDGTKSRRGVGVDTRQFWGYFAAECSFLVFLVLWS